MSKKERDVLLSNCSKIQKNKQKKTCWASKMWWHIYFYFILFKELIFISLGACRMCLTHPCVMLSGAWWIIHYRPLFFACLFRFRSNTVHHSGGPQCLVQKNSQYWCGGHCSHG